MSYILDRFVPLVTFGDSAEPLLLPPYDVASTIEPGAVAAQYVQTVMGGQFDGLGNADAHSISQVIRHSATFAQFSPADLEERQIAIDRQLGRAGRLWRKWRASLAQQWCYARFTSLEGESAPGQMVYQPVVMEFTRTSPWFAESPSTQQVTLGVTPYSFVVTRNVAANAPVFDAVITVTAQGVGITDLVIENLANGSYLRFTGTSITAGTSLVIDCGAGTVTNNGANAIRYLSLGAGHAIPDWFRLEAILSQQVRVTRAGGNNNSTIKFEFYEAWR